MPSTSTTTDSRNYQTPQVPAMDNKAAMASSDPQPPNIVHVASEIVRNQPMEPNCLSQKHTTKDQETEFTKSNLFPRQTRFSEQTMRIREKVEKSIEAEFIPTVRKLFHELPLQEEEVDRRSAHSESTNDDENKTTSRTEALEDEMFDTSHTDDTSSHLRSTSSPSKPRHVESITSEVLRFIYRPNMEFSPEQILTARSNNPSSTLRSVKAHIKHDRFEMDYAATGDSGPSQDDHGMQDEVTRRNKKSSEDQSLIISKREIVLITRVRSHATVPPEMKCSDCIRVEYLKYPPAPYSDASDARDPAGFRRRTRHVSRELLYLFCGEEEKVDQWYIGLTS
jgi:hypothetical protein